MARQSSVKSPCLRKRRCMHDPCIEQKSMAFESKVETNNRQPEIDNP